MSSTSSSSSAWEPPSPEELQQMPPQYEITPNSKTSGSLLSGLQCVSVAMLLGAATVMGTLPVNGADTSGSSKDKVKVFIFAGQSNMVGRSNPKLLPNEYRKAPPNLRLYADRAWRELGGPIRSRNDGIGPEVSAAHLLAEVLPGEKIVLVKTAVGGTSLHTDWNPDRKGSLYERMLRDVKVATAGRDAEIMALFWAQGGADTKIEAGAKAYGKNLAVFIERSRRDLGRPDLPFIFSMRKEAPPASPPPGSKYQFRFEVHKGKAEVVQTIPNTAAVATGGLTYKADRSHYDTAGTLEFGRRFFEAWEDGFHQPTDTVSRP